MNIINLFDHSMPLKDARCKALDSLLREMRSFRSEEKPREKITVLYVDDEPQNLISFRALFREKFEIYVTSSQREAEKIIKATDIDVVICDQKMPKVDGIQLLTKIRTKYPYIKRILTTAYKDLEIAKRAVNEAKVDLILEKPWKPKEVEMSIIKAYNE